jgi:queuine tRNA-ribosyltransferase
LYLRPGTEIIQDAGGVHKFIGWNKPLLTDSGGYQVYSLGNMRKISENGVQFRSHIDGSKHVFTPETAIEIQRIIGADILMAFDECTPYPCEFDYAKQSMLLTHRWLDRCCNYFDSKPQLYVHKQTLAPIVQGSTFKDLRQESAEYIAKCDREINAIGGLSVGEPHDVMYEMTKLVCDILPQDKPRYLMGVGTPANILECIGLGVDLFDCVLPTRNARHGLLYTREGVMNIKNEKWKDDFTAIDKRSPSMTSRIHSKAYLRHLILTKEYLGAQIASLHNLAFFLALVGEAREKIRNNSFSAWKNEMVLKLDQRL